MSKLSAEQILEGLGALLKMQDRTRAAKPVAAKAKVTKKRIKIDAAVPVLQEFMKFGPVKASKGYRFLRKQGWSDSSIDRIRNLCGIKPYKEPGKGWIWRLPSQVTAPAKPAAAPVVKPAPVTATESGDDMLVVRRSVLRLHDKVTAIELKIGSFHEQLKIIGGRLQELHADTKKIIREFVTTNPPPPDLIAGSDPNRNGHTKEQA